MAHGFPASAPARDAFPGIHFLSPDLGCFHHLAHPQPESKDAGWGTQPLAPPPHSFLPSLAPSISQHQVGLPSFLQGRHFLCVGPLVFSTMANTSLYLRSPGFTADTEKAPSWKVENLPFSSGLSRLLVISLLQRSSVKCKAEQGVFVVGWGAGGAPLKPQTQ